MIKDIQSPPTTSMSSCVTVSASAFVRRTKMMWITALMLKISKTWLRDVWPDRHRISTSCRTRVERQNDGSMWHLCPKGWSSKWLFLAAHPQAWACNHTSSWHRQNWHELSICDHLESSRLQGPDPIRISSVDWTSWDKMNLRQLWKLDQDFVKWWPDHDSKSTPIKTQIYKLLTLLASNMISAVASKILIPLPL